MSEGLWRTRRQLVYENCGLTTRVELIPTPQLRGQYRLRVFEKQLGLQEIQTYEQILYEDEAIEEFKALADRTVLSDYEYQAPNGPPLREVNPAAHAALVVSGMEDLPHVEGVPV